MVNPDIGESRRFWAALVRAILAVRPDVVWNANDLVDADRPDGPSVARALVDDLAGAEELPSLVVMLDDAHLLHAATWTELAWLVEHQPPNLQMVVVSRSDPPFSLPRWRSQADHYRYHPLLAELLRHEVRTEEPQLETDLHRRASRFYADEGTADAIDHALAGYDYEAARSLIEQRLPTLYAEGRRGQVSTWLDAVPDEFLLAEPERAVAPYDRRRGHQPGRRSVAPQWQRPESGRVRRRRHHSVAGARRTGPPRHGRRAVRPGMSAPRRRRSDPSRSHGRKPTGNGRFYGSCRATSPRPRSAGSSTSRATPSRPTSSTSIASSACPPARRRSRKRGAPVSSVLVWVREAAVRRPASRR